MKRLIDISGALIALIVLSPILILTAAAVQFTSSGPIFFRQKRLGKHGQEFVMLKFRSMVDGSEKTGTGLFTYSDDPRVTAVGNVIRKTSLDELPQLFNVLGGSMSLVGPRPPVTYELGPWDQYTNYMKRRFDVKPGITGLAQISGRNELDWDTKIEFDNSYVENFEKLGVLVDIKILFLSIWVVVAGRDTIEIPTEDNEGPIARKARQAMDNLESR